jgi:diguanylate cyclase (GGDEF)-like protein
VPLRAREPRADDPVDAALRAPHPAILVAWSLTFGTIIALAATVSRLRTNQGPTVTAVAAAVLALACAATAIVLISTRRARSMTAVLIGLALMDLLPPLLQMTAPSPTDARSVVALLILPIMIAAASLGNRVFRAQVMVAASVAATMLAVAAVGGDVWDPAIEIAVAVGVLLAGAVMVRRVSAATANHIGELRRLALTDKLTGVLNRRGLADAYSNLWAGGRGDVGVLSLDIDHFKWFNDNHGHLAGDEVLRLVCRELQVAAGPGGLVARTGGEELVALVHGPAEPVAEAFRAALAATHEPRVTVSIGILDVPTDDCASPDSLWQILDAADTAMYRAKTTGRDRVCRGTLDRSKEARSTLAPAPEHAAVPQPEVDARSTTTPLPGWMLAAVGLVGALSAFLRTPSPPDDIIGQLHMTIMVTCLMIGVIVVGMGPLLDRFRWVIGVVGSDLVVLVTTDALDDGAARRVAVLPVLLVGLMVAQHFRRRLLLAHHAATVVICMTAPLLRPTIASVVMSVFTAALLIGATELIYFLQARQRTAAGVLHCWSVTDPLTGLANRHGLELGFQSLSRAEQLTVLALDVDDFKGINDTYGHAAGDDALVRLAATLRTVTSPDTVVCRTGGDEFVVLAPSMPPSALTSKVKRAAALLPLPLSVSIGSAVAAPHRLRSLWQLVDAADAALMRAKRSRRQQRRDSREAPIGVLDDIGPAELTESLPGRPIRP